MSGRSTPRFVLAMAGVIAFGASCTRSYPYRPSSAYNLAEQLDQWTSERSTWMFAHCDFRGVTDVGTTAVKRTIPFVTHATNALVFGDQHLVFACPQATPWLRDDAAAVNDWLPQASQFLACQSSGEVAKVAISVPGTGPVIGTDSMVRVRARLTSMKLEEDTRISHGRLGKTLASGAAASSATPSVPTVPKGTSVPVPERPLVYTQHRACFGCFSEALLQLRAGAHADVTCQDESWEVEVMAVGGPELFTADLHLTSPGSP